MEPRAIAKLPSSDEDWARLDEDDRQLEAARPFALRELIAGYTREIEEQRREKPCGNALGVLLSPLVIRLARMVARGMGRGDRDDFVEEARNLVVEPREKALPRICNYDPEKGDLAKWLSVVLKNLWRSRYRAHQPTFSLDVDITSPPVSFDEGVCSVFDEEFSPKDLQVLATWPPWRIELLCLSGLWVKVPEAIWDSWLVEYEGQIGKGLVRPFPPGDFLAHDDHQERVAPLANALGVPRNRLNQHWYRAKVRRWWEELSCFAPLIGRSL